MVLKITVRNRLFFGTLMTILFTAIVIFDGWLDGSLKTSGAGKSVQATFFCVLIALIAFPAQMELAKLAEAHGLRIFTPLAIVSSILTATYWYWAQFINIEPAIFLFLLLAFTLMAVFLYQYFSFGINGMLGNCGVNFLAIMYLGLLSSFVIGIRIKFGLWPLLMFIFVIKSADIGAYAIGSIFGKHKFSPKISPGKTWEGMAGAVGLAIIVAVCFGKFCDIMIWQQAVIFGICFAFIGQMGDLVESMMKRDAQQKDSAKVVPGFGGVLDIIDSPLVAAPFAYLFFMLLNLIK